MQVKMGAGVHTPTGFCLLKNRALWSYGIHMGMGRKAKCLQDSQGLLILDVHLGQRTTGMSLPNTHQQNYAAGGKKNKTS